MSRRQIRSWRKSRDRCATWRARHNQQLGARHRDRPVRDARDPDPPFLHDRLGRLPVTYQSMGKQRRVCSLPRHKTLGAPQSPGCRYLTSACAPAGNSGPAPPVLTAGSLPMHVVCVAAARPNFMKIRPVIDALDDGSHGVARPHRSASPLCRCLFRGARDREPGAILALAPARMRNTHHG